MLLIYNLILYIYIHIKTKHTYRTHSQEPRTGRFFRLRVKARGLGFAASALLWASGFRVPLRLPLRVPLRVP